MGDERTCDVEAEIREVVAECQREPRTNPLLSLIDRIWLGTPPADLWAAIDGLPDWRSMAEPRDALPPPPGPARVTEGMVEAALEGYRQASHGCNAIPEWIRGALEAALPHGFVETDPVSVQPNPAQTSEVEAVAREMGEAIAKGRLHGYATPVGFPALIAWADRLEAALLHLNPEEQK